MSAPENVTCAIVQDLAIPYAAGEVRPETAAWINLHLSGCIACRNSVGALLQETQEARPMFSPPPVPPMADPGRRLVGRVRTQVIAIIIAVVAALALAAGGITWAVTAARNWARDPGNHPVPAGSATPAEAADIDLSALGLERLRVEHLSDGSIAHFKDAAGNIVSVEFHRLPSPFRAKEAYREWNGRFSVRTMSVEMNMGSVGSARFRSGGNYYQGWHDGLWFIAVKVPGEVPGAADLRAAIVDRLTVELGH